MLHPDLIEAQRLMREGRFAEATRLVQTVMDRIAPPSGGEASGARGAAVGNTEATLTEMMAKIGEAMRTSIPRVVPKQGGFSHAEPAAALPEGAQLVAASFANGSGRRDYKLYLPSRQVEAARPLVVMLHGCSQSPDDIAAGSRMNEVAEEVGALVVYPAQDKSANSSRCWNWFVPEHQGRDRGEPSIIAGIVDEVASSHGVDRDRIFVAGMSAGGAAAALLGEAYPNLFAAVGVHSGLPAGAAKDLPSALQAMQQGATGIALRHGVPTIVFHGDADNTVNPANGAAVIRAALAARPCPASETEQWQVPDGRSWSRTRHRDASGRVRFEHCVVHGAGHAWSGGSTAGSFTDPAGPHASKQMMRFFLEQVG